MYNLVTKIQCELSLDESTGTFCCYTKLGPSNITRVGISPSRLIPLKPQWASKTSYNNF